ncbi:hypothetical protein H0H92_010076, partial [Tricholoma furcatifolium]
MDATKKSLQMSAADVTPEFVSGWDLNALMDPITRDMTPVWSRILEAVTEPPSAKSKGRNVISAAVAYLCSFNSCKVQIAMGLVALANGASRDMINIMHASCLSVSWSSISNIIQSLSTWSLESAQKIASSQPFGISYDNINITTSIFVEQVPGAMNKVQSGTLSIL